MATLEGGPWTWSGSRDREGHREYRIVFKVRCESTEGPATAIQTPGLPLPGDLWIHDDDVDVYAWCKNEVDVRPDIEGEKNTYFWLTYTYSTKPDRLCQDHRIEDPLMEPQRIRGSFNKYQEVITKDRFGKRLVNHAYEPIRGDVVTFDANRPALQIEQNVLELEFDLLCEMIDRVNDEPIWDLPVRSVKLSDITWERHYHGACNCYFKRTFVFDVNVKLSDETSEAELVSGFDRDVMLEGTKVLSGYWDEATGNWQLIPGKSGVLNITGPSRNPDPYNPAHYNRAVDRQGKNITIIYDGRPGHRGEPFNPDDETEYISGCTTCDDSTGGAAETFEVEGIANDNLPLLLQHTTGCTWTASLPGGESLQLTCCQAYLDPSTGVLANYWTLKRLSPIGGVVAIWALEEATFNCVNDNSMLLNDGILGFPSVDEPLAVTLRVPPDSEPASLKIEHYAEADFTRLNIPLTLDCTSY